MFDIHPFKTPGLRDEKRWVLGADGRQWLIAPSVGGSSEVGADGELCAWGGEGEIRDCAGYPLGIINDL